MTTLRAAESFVLRYQYQGSLLSFWTLVSLPLQVLRCIEKWGFLIIIYIDSKVSKDCCSDLLLETCTWQFLLSICDCISVKSCIMFINLILVYIFQSLTQHIKSCEKLESDSRNCFLFLYILTYWLIAVKNGFESQFNLKINIPNLPPGKPMITHLRMPKHLCQKE